MAKDKHGNELQVGDTVLVEMKVTSLPPSEETVEVSLSRGEGQAVSVSCPSNQTEKVSVGEGV